MSFTFHYTSAKWLGASPWSLRFRLGLILWEWVWILFCIWTPKPWNGWRLRILRLFGARIHGTPFIHQRARIPVPWNLEVEEDACVGDRTHLYNLDLIHLGKACIVAQEAYLCTGTHDLNLKTRPLMTAPIIVGESTFIGARALILPGIELGEDSVIGAGSVVTRDVAAGVRVAGNPATPLS